MKTTATIFFALFAGIASAEMTLTSVAEANRLSIEDIKAPIPFDFTGTMFLGDDVEKGGLVFVDNTGGISFFAQSLNRSKLRQWDVVRAKGEILVADHDKTRRAVLREVEIIRHGKPIPPIDATAPEILTGKYNYRFVRIRGVIASGIVDEVDPDFFWASIRTENGKVLICINAAVMSLDSITKNVGAEAEIVGLARPISGVRRGMGNYLRVLNPGSVRIIKPPPEDPFSAAETLSDIATSPHRQRISGDVIAVARNRFYLKTGIGRTIMAMPVSGTPMPKPGERVEVVGFPEHASYWLSLADSIVRTVGKVSSPLDAPKKTTISQLFTDSQGRKIFNTHMNACRLSLIGKVKSATDDEIELTDGENSIFVAISSIRSQLEEVPEIGSTVNATGLCWMEFHNKYESDIYPVFLRFTLYPHDAEDIQVLASPPWWTPFRLLMLVLVFAVLLAGSSAWSIALNMKAERRGRELYEERASHAIAEKKVEERTRLAVELHDSISQTLTGVAMQLEVGNIETAQTMLTSCRNDLRVCLWDLRSRTFEEKDMTEAIERTLEPHSVGAKISVRFNVPRVWLSDSETHTILHIIRELVVNAIRHGHATEVKVAGEYHGNTISFSVRDNGCGFSPDNAPGPEQGHFGLLGIRERLKEFSGSFNIESAPGKGTKATVKLTIERDSYETENQNPPR